LLSIRPRKIKELFAACFVLVSTNKKESHFKINPSIKVKNKKNFTE